MTARDRIWRVAATAMLLTSTSPAWAQVRTNLTAAQMFAVAKPGQWIKIEGTPRKDQTVLCNTVRIMKGAIKDSAWSILGLLRSIDPSKHELTIGGYRVRLTEEPKYSNATSTLRGISDLKPGMLLKVKGVYSNDQGFVARKVNDESDQITEKPGTDRQIQVQGKIQRADAAKKTIVLMGTTFIVTSKTLTLSEMK